MSACLSADRESNYDSLLFFLFFRLVFTDDNPVTVAFDHQFLLGLPVEVPDHFNGDGNSESGAAS